MWSVVKKDLYRLVQEAGGRPLKSDNKHLLIVKLITQLDSFASAEHEGGLDGEGNEQAGTRRLQQQAPEANRRD